VTGDQNADDKNKVDAAVDDDTSGKLTPRTTCPSCGGREELRVYAPFEVWVSCTSCGYTDVFEYGTEKWATYVDLAGEWQARLFGGDEEGGRDLATGGSGGGAPP